MLSEQQIRDKLLSWGIYAPPVEEVGRAEQLRTIITGLVIAIAAMLGVIVMDDFEQSLGNPSNASLNGSKGDVLTGFADMIGLVGPLLLVLIAAVIIAVVQRLR